MYELGVRVLWGQVEDGSALGQNNGVDHRQILERLPVETGGGLLFRFCEFVDLKARAFTGNSKQMSSPPIFLEPDEPPVCTVEECAWVRPLFHGLMGNSCADTPPGRSNRVST